MALYIDGEVGLGSCLKIKYFLWVFCVCDLKDKLLILCFPSYVSADVTHMAQYVNPE